MYKAPRFRHKGDMRDAGPRRLDELAIAAAPAAFVLLWSTGFIGAKFGLPYAEPFTFLTLRFAIVGPMLALVALLVRAEWPRGMALVHNVVSGVLLHGLYLSGVFIAIDRGMPAGIAALFVGLQPILTSTLASRWLGEAVRPLQWTGLVLGLVGVYFVVEGRFGDGRSSGIAWAAITVALIGVTVGTLYQKRYGGGDLRGALPVQYAAAVTWCGLGCLLFGILRTLLPGLWAALLLTSTMEAQLLLAHLGLEAEGGEGGLQDPGFALRERQKIGVRDEALSLFRFLVALMGRLRQAFEPVGAQCQGTSAVAQAAIAQRMAQVTVFSQAAPQHQRSLLRKFGNLHALEDRPEQGAQPDR